MNENLYKEGHQPLLETRVNIAVLGSKFKGRELTFVPLHTICFSQAFHSNVRQGCTTTNV